MTRSKKIFVACAIAFALFLAYVAYDISSRTTFPGSHPKVKVPPSEEPAPDSASADTIR